MLDLNAIISKYATEKQYEFEAHEDGRFSIDVAMQMKDGNTRYQYVWIWVEEERAKDKACVFFASEVGDYDASVNLYELMKEANYSVYSSIAIVENHGEEDDETQEIILVQASPIYDYLEEDEFIYILEEVAQVADVIEESHFGQDVN